jgi:crossover junction endodeoxyribonuclease RuvC
MKNMTIGVDPGMSGALAILEGERLIQIIDMPVVEVEINGKLKRRISPEMLVSELGMYLDFVTCAYVEKVSAMPGQGVSSMFAFGEALGLIRGIFAGLRVPCFLVPPSAWKRTLKVPQGKDASRAMAAQLWPLNAAEFKRVKDDGRAEAALIALWGSRQ